MTITILPSKSLCPGTPHRWHPRPGSTPCWKDVAAWVGNSPSLATPDPRAEVTR